MGKILYIEDQLTNNTEKIIRLFSTLFPDEEITQALQETMHRPEEIVHACHRVSCLDICYQFPIALEKIINHHDEYDLFIIDRNLSLQDYSAEKDQIMTLMSVLNLSNTEAYVNKYFEREGDLLLWVLLSLFPTVKNRIFILTANATEHLSILQELEDLLISHKFDKKRIIIKSTDNEEYLIKAISDSVSFQIGNEYHEQCSILRKRMSEHEVNQFIEMIRYGRSMQKIECLTILRKLLEKMLCEIASITSKSDDKCWDRYNISLLMYKTFIKGGYRDETGLPVYQKKIDIGYNSIIKNACLSIYEITSDFGVHNADVSSVSKYTIQSLLAQICDVVLWYDKAIGLITK